MSKKLLPLAAVAALCMQLSYGVLVGKVSAAPLTRTVVRTARMQTNEDTWVRVKFRTVGAGATSVSINFTTAWSSANGTVDATQTATGVAGCDDSATALPGTLSASGSGETITITGVTALSATTTYCVDLNNAGDSVNLPDAGEYYPVVTVGADSVTTAVRVIADDQVDVSATVPPSFNFALNQNSTVFTANLASNAVRHTSVGTTATINTNAINGWHMWARDANTGLQSTNASKTIASTTPGTGATLSAGTEGYVVGFEVATNGTGGGTPAITAAYAGTNADEAGSGLDTTLRQVASSGGTANGDVIRAWGKAAIAGDTPAATDYTDVWTFIGAGSF